MPDSTDWWQFAYPSPENNELVRVLQELERIYRSHASLDRQEPRRWSVPILKEFRSTNAQSLILTERLDGVPFEAGGDEHVLCVLAECPDRIFKVTHSDNFGCITEFHSADPEFTERHFLATGNDNPFRYLERWLLLNSVSAFQTRFEGILPAEPPLKLPRICVSQPMLDGRNPKASDITASLNRYGFVRVCEDAFFSTQSGILLTDAAPRNVWIVDNVPVVFDAIASLPSPIEANWIKDRTGIRY